MVLVTFINFGSLFLADIQQIPEKYKYASFYMDDPIPPEGFWLCAYARREVHFQLKEKGLDPYNYISPATVHGKWKIQKHQGIIYPTKIANLTKYANVEKPIPSRKEIEELEKEIQKFINSGYDFDRIVSIIKTNYW